MQSVLPSELAHYLTFFKVPSPPLFNLLTPLYRMALAAQPQPNFILSFPSKYREAATIAKLSSNEEVNRSVDKAESLVNTFRKKHLSAELCSPWSVHAICLPIGAEMAWTVWCHGCAASLWLRIERGSGTTNTSGLQMMSGMSSLINSESDSLSDWGVLSDNWSREGKRPLHSFIYQKNYIKKILIIVWIFLYLKNFSHLLFNVTSSTYDHSSRFIYRV